MWILRYHANEIDDGSVAIGPPYQAQLDAWVNGESVSDDDVVVWYAAHFSHDVTEMHAAEHGHILGPDLRPLRCRRSRSAGARPSGCRGGRCASGGSRPRGTSARSDGPSTLSSIQT